MQFYQSLVYDLSVCISGVSLPSPLPLPFSLQSCSSCVTSAGVAPHTVWPTHQDVGSAYFFAKPTTKKEINE